MAETNYLKLERKSVIDDLLNHHEEKFLNATGFHAIASLTHTIAILNNRKSQTNDDMTAKRMTVEIKHHTNEHGEATGNNWSSLGVGGCKVVAMVFKLDEKMKVGAEIAEHTFGFSERVLENQKQQRTTEISYHRNTKERVNEDNTLAKRTTAESVQTAFQRAQGTDDKETQAKQAMVRQ